MIKEIHYRRCTKCGSKDIIKNGHDYKGAQKFHCHACKAFGTLDRKRKYDAKTRQQVLDAYFERVSMRGIHRVFGVTRYLLAQWLLLRFEKLPVLAETLVNWELGDVLELDELWSFVLKKSQKRWIWIALLLDKLLPLLLAIEVKILVASFGIKFQWFTNYVHLSVTFGKPTKMCFLKKHIKVSVKKLA